MARTTAADASDAYPSAPTTSAYSWVTGAPPTMTMTWSRSPALFSALMFALNIGIVVVRNAEKPTMSGLCSWIAATNFSGATCTPRSMTSNPAPSNMMLTRFLPMSCTSPLTVPITIFPIVCGAGLGQQRAQDLQRAGHRLARDEHLGHEEVAALEPGAHLFQRRDQRLVQQRLRTEALGQALVGELEHRRAVADQRLVVELAEQLFCGHAAPAFRFCLLARCR